MMIRLLTGDATLFARLRFAIVSCALISTTCASAVYHTTGEAPLSCSLSWASLDSIHHHSVIKHSAIRNFGSIVLVSMISCIFIDSQLQH